MKLGVGRRHAAGLAGVVLIGTALVAGTPASGAAPSNAVPFGQANFHGYGTGTEVHVDALDLGTTKVADVEQAFSGASTSTAGLTSGLANELGIVVQPAQAASVHAYSTGTGLELGLGTATTAVTDANQILLAGKVQQVAPPNTNPTTQTIGPIGTTGSPTAALGGIVQASALTGQASAIYDPNQCPIGQPISSGLGNAANANVLAAVGAPLVNTAESATSAAQTTSETYLAPNGDSTWGLASTVTADIAPITVNLGTGASLQVSVATNGGVNEPVTLTAKTSGESAGSVAISPDDVLTVNVVVGSTTVNVLKVDLGVLTAPDHGLVQLPLDLGKLNFTIGEAIGLLQGLANSLPSPLNTAVAAVVTAIQTAAAAALQPLSAPLSTISSVIDVNLGEVDTESLPHAIGQPPTTSPSVSGTAASGAIDLLKASLGLSLSGTVGTTLNLPPISLANIAAGHMEVSSNTAAPITCSIPVIKVADPSSVTAGNPFTYTINVPNPAELPLLDCSLSHLSVSDTIGDKPGSTSTFQVNSAQIEQANSSGQLVPLNVPATITQPDPTHATVSWSGLSWTLGSPPLVGVITVSVPKTSPAGTIQDTVTATAILTGCQGGTAGQVADNQQLTGTYTLQQPSVAAVTQVGPGATTTVPGATATTQPRALPFTGAMGGPWQPIAGLAALGLGGGAFALSRRSRRRRTTG